MRQPGMRKLKRSTEYRELGSAPKRDKYNPIYDITTWGRLRMLVWNNATSGEVSSKHCTRSPICGWCTGDHRSEHHSEYGEKVTCWEDLSQLEGKLCCHGQQGGTGVQFEEAVYQYHNKLISGV